MPVPEVVITGVGVVSPIGVGREDFSRSLREGRSGIATLSEFGATPLPVRFGAEVREFDPKELIQPRKSLKVMCREVQFGMAASMLALTDAAWIDGSVDPERFGVVFAGGMFYSSKDDMLLVARNCIADGRFENDRWGEQSISDIFPLWLLKYLPSMTAAHLAIRHQALGPNNTIGMGDVSSLVALIEAAHVIRRGDADVMIAGGTDSRLNITAMLVNGDHLLSHRNDEPARASRPFDAARDGTVLGEGAGALILESKEHAEARGATILARVMGDGIAFQLDRGDATLPTAYQRAIVTALAKSSLDPGQVGHVNAHGASTVAGDRDEAQAIHVCLNNVPVTAPKSYFGNLGAGSGLVEAAVSILALIEGEIPPTLNYRTPDPECPINVVRDERQRVASPFALLLNASNTGQVAAVVLGAA